MRLFFLLAILTFALTELAASTSPGKPPGWVDKDTAYNRCKKYCGPGAVEIDYDNGRCHCKDNNKKKFSFNVYSQILIKKKRVFSPKTQQPDKKRPRDPDNDDKGNKVNKYRKVAPAP
ncbi:hypothetical protein BDB01DRAFT_784232 [Pilobolus umbonatus]|nr:hypothetical protein BDB01DRAFT_784232 [Pilobolus umbonatus]